MTTEGARGSRERREQRRKTMRRLGFAVSATLATGAVLACMAFGVRTQSAAGKAAQSGATAAQVPAAGKAIEMASAGQIEPRQLAELLNETKGEKPAGLHVGFKNFYEQ